MKIGINLVGISKGEQGTLRWQKPRDWKNYKDSIYKNVINCWNHDTYVYITTYNHDNIPELLDFYKPIKYQILELDNSHLEENDNMPKKGNHYTQQVETYIKSLNMIKNEDLDFIISTRFDIDFFDPISTYNIDFNKFNFLFKEGFYWSDECKIACDNLFCFPMKYMNDFIESVNEHNVQALNLQKWLPGLHFIQFFIEPKITPDNIHFIMEDLTDQYSHNNKYYSLYVT